MKVKMKPHSLLILIFVTASILLVSCGKQGAVPAAQPADDTTPVTLSFGGSWTSDVFNQRVGDLLKTKFPYITIQYVQFATGSKLSDLVTKGQVPDIIEGGSQDDPKNSWAPLGVAFDLTPLIQKNKLDLTKFDAAYLQNVRRGSVDGQLDSLPYYLYENVLYYNKTIFDKFGVTYPTDGMTWPQVYELTKKVTQKDANVQYRGLEPDDFARIARQYPLLYLDPKTDKANLTNDKWVNLMTFLKDVY
ncbi:MAG: extracellular solute-binding protein family 1, partial [Bacilli bacterium]|nr:extracellular solute-binding protein family 1 [Bacilli bacterium]